MIMQQAKYVRVVRLYMSDDTVEEQLTVVGCLSDLEFPCGDRCVTAVQFLQGVLLETTLTITQELRREYRSARLICLREARTQHVPLSSRIAWDSIPDNKVVAFPACPYCRKTGCAELYNAELIHDPF